MNGLSGTLSHELFHSCIACSARIAVARKNQSADPVSVLKAISVRNKSGAEHFKVAKMIKLFTIRCRQACFYFSVY